MREEYQLIEIRELFENVGKYAGGRVTVGGWIRNNRDSKNIGFIVLNDGSTFKTLQLVYSKDLENFADVARLNVGSAVIATVSPFLISQNSSSGTKYRSVSGCLVHKTRMLLSRF